MSTARETPFLAAAKGVGATATVLAMSAGRLPFRWAFWKGVLVLLAVGVVAYGLIFLRRFFFVSIPWLKLMTRAFSGVWNEFLRAVDALRPVLTTILHFAEHVLDQFKKILKLVAGDAIATVLDLFTTDLIIFNAILTLSEADDSIDAGEVTHTLDEILAQCPPYHDTWSVVGKAIRLSTHDGACAAARYVYPVPWLFSAANLFLQPLYAGSAAPIVDHHSVHQHYNCEHTIASNVELPPFTCIVIGCGFAVRDALVPVLAALMMLFFLGGATANFLTAIVKFAAEVAKRTVHEIQSKLLVFKL